MTTWAARLCNSTNKQSRSDVEETNLSAMVKDKSTLTENGATGKLHTNKEREYNKSNKVRLESPESAMLISSPRKVAVTRSNKNARDCKQDVSKSTCTTRALSEQFRLLALTHNANCVAVPVLQLPVDCWQVITSFINYTDLTQLSSVCVSLFHSIHFHESIWECQLRYFRSDMRNLRNGSLLLTRFALPPFDSEPIPVLETKNSEQNTNANQTTAASKSKILATSTRCRTHNRHMSKSYERLKWERQLYMMDSQREWYFSDFTSLEDVETGVFTVPLQLSGEENLNSLLGANNNTKAALINSPPMGHPFEVEHHSLLHVRIFKLKRPILGDNDVGMTNDNKSNINGNKTYNNHDYYVNSLDSEDRIMHEAYGSMPFPSFSSSRSTSSSSSSLSSSLSSSSLLTSSLSRLSSASSLHTPHYYGNNNKSVTTQSLPSQRYANNSNSNTNIDAISRAYWELQGCEEEDEEAALERVLALSRAEADEYTTPIHTQVEQINTNNGSNHRTFHCCRDTPLSISPQDERHIRKEEECSQEEEEQQHSNIVVDSLQNSSHSLHDTEPHETMVENIKRHHDIHECNMNYVVTNDDDNKNGNESKGNEEQKKEQEEKENYNDTNLHVQQLTCRDIMTVVELLNANLTELSLFEVNDMTVEEDDVFMQALRETLTKALRRRLHLGNHHRGLRNNGQTSRHRTRQLRRHNAEMQNANNHHSSNSSRMLDEMTGVRQTDQLEREARGDESLLSLLPMEERMHNEITPTTTTTTMNNNNNNINYVQSAFTNGQLPPVNRMLREFTGVLLELTRHEAHKMCRVLADGANVRDKLRHFEDVNSYQLYGVRRIKRMLIPLPHTHSLIRYFVVPELCVDNKIGLLLVDAVRVLFIVEKEITATLDLLDLVVERQFDE